MKNLIEQKKEQKQIPMYVIEESKIKLHISKGNSKIGKGIWSFSTLPGKEGLLIYITNKATGEKVLLTDIPGTCTGNCEACFHNCYAVNSARQYHNTVIPAWAENTLLLRNGKLWEKLGEFIDKKNNNKRSRSKIEVFRINVSGEIENVDELNQWAKLAEAHKEILFGVYTKNYEALGEYFDANIITTADGARTLNIPDNFTINVSEWHGVAKAFLEKYNEFKKSFNIFEYDDSNLKDCSLSDVEKERISKLIHCPGIDKNGHHKTDVNGKPITCDRCGLCYGKHGKGLTIAVYAH